MDFRLVFFAPSREFRGEEELRNADPTRSLRDLPLTFFNAAGVAVVMSDEIQWEATMYLAESSIYGKGQTGDTVRTYGECLVSYLNFLTGKELKLEEVTEYVLQAYRNFLISESGAMGKLAIRTVNLRTSTASRFHQWGELRGHFPSPLGKFLVPNRTSGRTLFKTTWKVSHAQVNSPKFMLPTDKRIPRIMTTSELRALFQASVKPFSLMFKWASVTGLRRFEICSLRISELPPRADIPGRRLREMRIVRKGGKEVTVYIPNALIDETWWYVTTDRPTSYIGNDDCIFLSRSGKHIARQYFSSTFKKCSSAIAPGATLHHLRHTFAVLTLTLLQQRADQGDPINPLKTLQVLMGHSSINSTEIYLRALDMHSETVEETLDFLYGETL